MEKQKKILIVGSIPPPVGGVTIHLYRLLKALANSGLEHAFYDYKKEPYLQGLKNILKHQYVHTNFGNKYARFLSTLLLTALGKKVVLTFHSKFNFTNWLDRLSLALSFHAFVLNKYTYEHASRIVGTRSVQLISAFIPPTDGESELSAHIAGELASFTRDRKIIVCTNAYSYVLDKDGRDLYGIDFLLEIFSTTPENGLIVSDPSGKLKERYASYTEIENILFISEIHPFIEVLKVSDVFVRATTTDGDSLSVKEALHLNKKTITSDAVDRVKGCLIYKTGDRESFMDCLNENIKPEPHEIENGALTLIKFYQEICRPAPSPELKAASHLKD